jgi:protein TonB
MIAGGVVAFHVAALWAFQSGLLQRAVEVVVPVSVLTEFIEPPKPKPAPPPPPPPPAKPVVQPKVSRPPPAPMPIAIPDPVPAPQAPVGTTEPPAPLPPIAAPVAPPAPPAPAPAPPAPPAITLPSTNADYLQNPPPAYPAVSKRLGEQGKVLLRVLIGVDGLPKSIEVKRSSGFERLDRAAMDAVRNWRFVPGKRNGVAEQMAYDLPLNFVLN